MTDVGPTVGITIGDAAGIGPEIVLKAVATSEIAARCVLIGDSEHLKGVSFHLTQKKVKFVKFDPSKEAVPGVIEVVDLNNLPQRFTIGVDSAVTGKAAAENIIAAVDLWRQCKIDAICTAPISKKAVNLGGYDFPGHTEFFADLTDTREFAMSFFADRLRVVLLSTHHSLRDALNFVKRERIVKLIGFADKELRRLLRRDASIAVAGLNPHASEDGKFGTEERDEIAPAVEYCRSQGIDVSGPYSPDTIFLRGHNGEFDAVIALYHDQATIAVKSLSFGTAVNVTLGLPLIRTSVDHGTAYDIAGKGVADASSMRAAIKLASELAQHSQAAAEI